MPSFDKTKKTGLGRGLGSLLGGDLDDIKIEPTLRNNSVPNKEKSNTKEIAPPSAAETTSAARVSTPAAERIDKSARVWKLDIEAIKANESQPRKAFDKEALRDLSLSIRTHGVLQPITVREKSKGAFEIIAGERRWRASQLAGVSTIPAIIKDTDDKQSLELALIENIQRADLNPVEEAEAYQQLIEDYDLTQEEVAKRVGKDRATVTNSLRLLRLESSVRNYLIEGQLTAGHAKALLAVTDLKTQKELAKETIRKGLSVRKLEALVKKSNKTEEKSSGIEDLDLAGKLVERITDDLQKRLSRKVSIDYNRGKGKIAISFYSDEELSEISEKLKNAWTR